MIAVTGASGHLGQWVVSRLLARGHEVVCVSRRPAGSPSIDPLRWAPGVRTLACDLADPETPAMIRRELSGVQGVAHLAAFVPEDTAANTASDAVSTLRTNVVGTVGLLEGLSGLEGITSLVYASTFEVYGAPVADRISEDHPTDPLGYYGASKLAAEKYVALFGSDRGVACCTLRLPGVYGPGDTLRRSVGNFVRAASAGDPIVVHGDGSDRRDFITAEEAAVAIDLALQSGASGVVNVGSGHGYSIMEIAETVSRVAGGSPIQRGERVKPRVDYVLDVTRAREQLGWEPAGRLEDGIRAQLEWQRRRRGLPRG
jgi:UDP-glucose 4-epimerase